MRLSPCRRGVFTDAPVSDTSPTLLQALVLMSLCMAQPCRLIAALSLLASRKAAGAAAGSVTGADAGLAATGTAFENVWLPNDAIKIYCNSSKNYVAIANDYDFFAAANVSDWQHRTIGACISPSYPAFGPKCAALTNQHHHPCQRHRPRCSLAL